MSRPSVFFDNVDELRNEYDWMYEFMSRMAESIRCDPDVHNLHDYVAKIEAENAKLRDLLKDMWASMADCHDICATCKHFEDEYEAADGSFGHTGECVFLRRMQELGIEVTS